MNERAQRRLGERNPATLPGSPGSETEDQNRAGTRFWRTMRRYTHPVSGCGVKY